MKELVKPSKKTLVSKGVVRMRVMQMVDEDGVVSFRVDLPAGAKGDDGVLYDIFPWAIDGMKGLSLKVREEW